MKKFLLNSRAMCLLGASSLLLACGPAGLAADRTWDGGDTTPNPNWSAVLNWDGDTTAPVSGDNLIFTGGSQTVNTNDIANLAPGWMLFDAPGFSISGASLTLAGGITNSLNAGGATVDMPLTLSGAQTFYSDSGTLTFNGTIANSGNLIVAGLGSVAWAYVPTNTTPLKGLMGPGNLIINGPASVTVSGGFVYPVNGNNFQGHTIVNSGGVLNMGAGSFDGNSLVGQSLTINPGGTVYTTAAHIAGASGRPLNIFGGTLDMGNEAYFTTVTLSNATLTTSTTKDLRGSGAFTNLASATSTTFGVALNLTSPRTIVVQEGAANPDIDFTGNGTTAITGGSALTKAGPGKMTISGAATHTSTTTVSEGTLALGGVGSILNSPAITLASNAVFDVSAASFSLATNQTLAGFGTVLGTVNDNNTGAVVTAGANGTAGTLTIDTLTLSGNLALNFDLVTNNVIIGGATNDLLVVTNLNLSTTGTNTVNLSALSGALTKGVPYTLIKYTACNLGAGAVTTLATPPSHFIYSFNNDTANSRITVTITGNPFNLVWKGGLASNVWDITTTTNWLVGGVTPDLYYDGDNTTFNDSGSNLPPVNLTATVKPTTLTVNATKDYTFGGAGKISGGTTLVKNNSGSLTLLTENDFTGGGNLSGSGAVNVGAGGPTGNIGSGNLTNNTRVTFNRTANATYAGNMSGTGSVTVNMPAVTLTMPGSNTFTGGLTIQNGTAQIGNNPTVSGASVAGSITNYGTLIISRTEAFTNQNPITSAGNSAQFSSGDVQIRGNGGMTVDGTAGVYAGGNFSVSQNLYGKLTVESGGLINVAGQLLLGNQGNIASDVIQNGGTINVSNHVRLAHWANNASTFSKYAMNGGTLNVPNGQVAVGWDGIGLMTVSNGTINARSLTVDDSGTNAPINNTNSMFVMTGGTLNIGAGGIGGIAPTGGITANIVFSGGTVGAPLANWSTTRPLRLTNGSPTFDTYGNTITLSGALSGNGGLTKQGGGVLQLDGLNTYTNFTTVAAGRLQGSGTISSPVAVSSGAVLSAGGTLARATLTISNNVTVSNAASILIDQASTALSSDLIRVAGNLTLDAATPLNLVFTGGLPYTGGTNVIITNTGTRLGNLSYVNPTRYSVVLDQGNANYITTYFTGTNANLVWKGNLSSTWDANTTFNWLNGASSDKYYQSDAVILDSTGIGSPNVTLAAEMTPASLFVNAAGSYTLSGGALTSVGTLTKNGSGTLRLANDTTFTGGANVNTGTLQIGNGGAAGTYSGNILNNSAVVFNSTSPSTYAGVLSGSGTVTAAGTGPLLVTGTSTYTGGTIVNPGSTIQVGNGPVNNNGQLGNGPVNNGGTVVHYRTSGVTVPGNYSGGGLLSFLGTGIADQSAYTLSGTNTFTGPVSLSLARLQPGNAASFGNASSINVPLSSSLYVPVAATFNIPLTLNGAGWLEGAGRLGALRLSGGANWAGNITLAGNTRISPHSDTASNVVSGTITGAYELETGTSAAGVLYLSPASPNSFSSLRLSPGILWLGNANALPATAPLVLNGGTLRLNGNNYAPSSLQILANSTVQNFSTTAPASLTLNPLYNSSLSFGSTLADGSTQPLHVTINQTGPSAAIAFTAASTSWGGNFTNNGGIVSCGVQNFSSQSIVGRNMVFNNGAVFNTTLNNILNGYNGNVVLNNSTWNLDKGNGSGATVYCSFAAAGSLTLSNSTITGFDSADGNYEMLQLPRTVMVRGTAPSYMLGTGTSCAYDVQSVGNGGTTFDVADTTGNANSDLIVGGGASTTFIHSPANTTTGGSLTKIGAGTMELGGANTYSGSTVVSNGTLALSGSATLANSSRLTVHSGATLDVSALTSGALNLFAQTLSGNGTVKGNVNDGTGTVISPGTSAGTLTVSNLTLNGTGSLKIELANVTTVGGGVNDLIQVNGDLSLNDSIATPVNFTFLNGAPAVGTYRLMNYTGALTGTGAGLTNTQGYAVTFSAGSGIVTATFAAPPSQPLVWQGDGAGNTWDLVTTSVNWSNTTANLLTNFYQLDAVRFDDSSVNTNVDVAGSVNPASITFDSTNDYTLQGAGKITGATTITKNNTNTVTLGLLNDAVGPVNVNAGVLQGIGDVDESYDGMTTITVANGAAFDFNGTYDNVQTQPHSFVLAGSGPDGNGALRNTKYPVYSFTYISNITLVADTVLGASNRWDIGPLAGSIINGQGNKLTKVGTGSIDIRAQIITNVASITVSNGYMFYESYDQTNAWTATTTNFVKPGARLGNYGARRIGLPISLDTATIQSEGGGTPQWLSPIRIETGSVFNNGGAQNFYGPISGPGAMFVDGGTSGLTVTNANTYSGGTVISNAPASTITYNSASVVVKHPNALGTGPVNLNLGSYTNNSVTNYVHPLDFELANGAVFTNDIVYPSSVISNISLWAYLPVTPSTFTLAGKLTGGHSFMTNALMAWDGANSLRLSNPANDFVAPSINLQWVTLGLAANNVLGNINNKLRIDNNSGSSIRFDAAGINLAHPVEFAQSGTIRMFGDNNGDGTPDTINNATISGTISGTGSPINVRGTNAVLTLTGNNTYTGSMELVEPAILQVAASTNLGVGAVALKAGTLRYTGTGSETMTRSLWNDNAALVGATVDVTSPTASLTWNPAGGTCNQILNKTGAGALTLGTLGLSGGLNVNGGPLTVNSVISGNSTVTVNNGASLTLNGANTHIFPTVVNNGSLYVNGSTAAGSSVSVSGLGSSVLGGVGTINGPVTVNVGAALQPGTNAIGKLTINNSLSLSGTTTMEVSNTGTTTNDLVTGLISVFYGGTLNVNNLGVQADLTNGVKFTLFSSIVRLGSFGTLNLPPVASGCVWSNKLALDGSIEVVTSSAAPTPTTLTNSIAGNQLTLSWPAGQGWRLMSQTNARSVGLTTPTNTWYEFAPAASNTVTISIEKTNPTVFFRLLYP